MLILLTVSLGGVFTLEQPRGSVLEYYPCFRAMLNKVYQHGGPYADHCLNQNPFLLGVQSVYCWQHLRSCTVKPRLREWRSGWDFMVARPRSGIISIAIRPLPNDWTKVNLFEESSKPKRLRHGNTRTRTTRTVMWEPRSFGEQSILLQFRSREFF